MLPVIAVQFSLPQSVSLSACLCLCLSIAGSLEMPNGKCLTFAYTHNTRTLTHNSLCMMSHYSRVNILIETPPHSSLSISLSLSPSVGQLSTFDWRKKMTKLSFVREPLLEKYQ